MILHIDSAKAIDAHLAKVRSSSDITIRALRELPKDPLQALARLKFEPVGVHPLEERPLNTIEQINQTFTYLAALIATGMLFKWHRDVSGYQLAPGAHAPRGSLDIQSNPPGVVGAETFASVDPKNNRKLQTDLKKLSSRSEQHRYVFFISPLYPVTARQTQLEQNGIQVWSLALDF